MHKPSNHSFTSKLRCRRLLVAVVADGLHRTALQGFHAERGIFLRGRLLMDERVAPFVMAGKERRRSLAAEITVNALLIDEKLAGGVLLPLVCFIGHSWQEQRVIARSVKRPAVRPWNCAKL